MQVGRLPFACVWDPRTCKQRQRLDHDELRGIAAVVFSADAKRLISAGMDNQHTLTVWDWRAAKRLAICKGANNVPPAVWGLVASPTADEFISFGVNHIKFWAASDASSTNYSLQAGSPSFSRASKLCTPNPKPTPSRSLPVLRAAVLQWSEPLLGNV